MALNQILVDGGRRLTDIGFMSVALSQLTETQRRFVKMTVATGMLPTQVGQTIGCDKSYVWYMLSQPHIQAALQQERTAAIGLIANLSVNELRRILTDETLLGSIAGQRLRLEAAKTVLDRAGHIAPKAKELDGAGDKPLTELSRDELHARLQQIEGELARQATEVAPVDDELAAFFA